MNRFLILLSVSIMFFTAALPAQKKQGQSMQWKIAGELPVAKNQSKALGFAGPVAGVCEKKMIVAGGANFPDAMPWFGGRKKYYSDVFVYVKKGSRVVLQKKQFKLAAAVAYAACCSTSKGIVYAGGENEQGISKKVFLLQLIQNAPTLVVQNLPDLPVAVTNASMTVNGNTIYIAGGERAEGVSDMFFSLDMEHIEAGWKQLPLIPKPVSHAVLVFQKSKDHEGVFLVGGRRKNPNGISDLYNSVFEFNLSKEQWTEKKSLPYTLSAGTGIATGMHSILLFGGDKGETFHKVEMLIAAINAEKDDLKKQQLVQQKNQLQITHPGFCKEVLCYNTITGEWSVVDSIPFDTPVTTVAFKWEKNVLIPGGEIKAGIRSPYILSATLNSDLK